MRAKQVWKIYAKKADFKSLGQRFGVDQVIARIIRNRDVVGEEEMDRYLNGTPEDLNDPHLLNGASEAARLLLENIRGGKHIRVCGDYDCDGVCSTYILLTAIRHLGGNADWDIPERTRDGYGINERMVRKAAADGVDLIITCDNGIAAKKAVQEAEESGIRVIVTDHHEIQPDFLPQADVLVDPKMEDHAYPFSGICGAVTAWKVVTLLYEMAGEKKDEYLTFLPFAALATVTDVMELRDENRIIVKYGLRAFQNTDHIGLRALLDASGLSGSDLSAYHFGFVIGPCMNSAGRLSTAQDSLGLLLETDPEAARQKAEKLVVLNNERKTMTDRGVEEAFDLVENTKLHLDKIYVLFLPDVHESIVGLVAGKVKEKYHHPVFVLTRAAGDGLVKGSGRSIESWNMFEGLQKVSQFLEKFGGHRMAAGLTLKEENLDAFRTALNESCELADDDFIEKVMIDVPMPLEYITEGLIGQLKLIEPCGNGNPKPVFGLKDIPVRQARYIGRERKYIKFRLADRVHGAMDAIYFGDAEEMTGHLREKFGMEEVNRMFAGLSSRVRLTFTYYPSVNEYNGSRSLQIVISNYL